MQATIETTIQCMLAQYGIQSHYITSDLKKHWGDTCSLLSRVDWNKWKGFLASEGFDVNTKLSMETVPVLQSSLRRPGYTIGISFGYGDGWENTASIDLAAILKGGVCGFEFQFDHGWNGRAIYGGGVWLIKKEWHSPTPYEPPEQLIKDKIKQFSESSEFLLKRLGELKNDNKT